MLNQLDENKYPLFVSFLRENNIYDSYQKYAHELNDHHIPHLAICGAFIFCGTEEGEDFWYKMEAKWIDYYKQFKDESI